MPGERFPLANFNRAFVRGTRARGREFDIRNTLVRDTIRLEDDFHRLVIDATNMWAAAANGAGSAAPAILASATGGAIRLTTGTDNNGDSILARTLNFTGDQNPVISARIRLTTSIASVKVEVGFSDSVTGRGVINVLNTPSATATDGVVAIFDTSATSQNWQFAGVRTGAAWSAISLPLVAPGANTWTWVTVALRRVDLATDDMDAVMFVDGVQVAYKRLSACANTVAMTPFVYAQTRTTTSRNVDVDYVSILADRDTSA